jgi:hypothetical protein
LMLQNQIFFKKKSWTKADHDQEEGERNFIVVEFFFELEKRNEYLFLPQPCLTSCRLPKTRVYWQSSILNQNWSQSGLVLTSQPIWSMILQITAGLVGPTRLLCTWPGIGLLAGCGSANATM